MTDSWYAEIRVQAADVASIEEFRVEVDRVAECLYAIAPDARLSADGQQMILRFGFVVTVDDPDAALAEASATTRTALHASGASTPDWPASFPKVGQSADRAELVSA